MRKIGILTFHFPENRNFGASLQSYAVLRMFEKLGYDAKLINFNPYFPKIKAKLFNFIIGKGFIEYNKKFLKETKKIEAESDFRNLNKEFDIFVSGSDQVWRPEFLKDQVKRYYFDFVNKEKIKIAYAPSFGVDFWEGDSKLTKEIKELTNKINYISVREKSGIEICMDIFDVNAICVLDPTLMIEKIDYQVILDDWKDKNHKNKKYIAHMLLDDTVELREETNNIGEYLKSEINYIKGKEISFNGKNIKLFGRALLKYNKVSQWLTYLKDAELIVTDSFHCTVFSLIFNKKFIVVANPERGAARLENLLGIVGLKDRFFTNIKDVLKSGILDKNIDYVEVEKKLNVHREYSMNFLKTALGESNE